MNLVDVIILLSLALGAVIGFKRGFFKQTVMFLGIILVFYLAFKLKGPVSVFLYDNFPFFDFQGLTSLNILLYEGIAFIVVLIILYIVLKILIAVSGIVEKILDFTIILAIPSKILGLIMGVLESYVIIYLVLFVLSFPVFNIKMIEESSYKDAILNNTPLLSSITSKTTKLFHDIFEIKDEKIEDDEADGVDKKIFDIIVNSGIIATDKLNELVESGKLKFE
jgi:uncharacterized membrane protein required for colicin V production